MKFYSVIIHRNIDIQVEYFLEKVLNFDIFCRDNKSWVPLEYNSWINYISELSAKIVIDLCLRNVIQMGFCIYVSLCVKTVPSMVVFYFN